MTRILSIFLLVLLLACCSRRPKDIIPEKKMVSIMADLQIAEAYQQNSRSLADGIGNSYGEIGRRILAYYGVSEVEMDSTLSWYGRNMDEYSKLYKKVDKELVRRQTAFAKAAGESVDEDGPSADLWPYGRHMVISPGNIADGLVVSIPATEVAPGDRLTWKMRASGSVGARDMLLGVDYEDGSSSIIRQSERGDKWGEISLQTDSILTVERIFGVMRYESNGGGVLYLDSIQLLHQPMKSDEYHRISYQKNIGKPARKVEVKVEKDSLFSGSQHHFPARTD